MDEFNEIEKDLERLKAELNFQDESLKEFRMPSLGDYWRKRFDEEKIIFEKKLELKKEEQKSLEKAMENQKNTIIEYANKLKEIEKKFNQEDIEWQKRLAQKETDLLIERNRMLNEEKVKMFELENKKIIQDLSEAHKKVAGLEELSRKEKAMYEDELKKEITVYEQNIKAHERMVESVREKMGVLENLIIEREVQIETISKELKETKESAKQSISEIEKQKTAAEGKLDAQRTAYEADVKRYKEEGDKAKLDIKKEEELFVSSLNYRRGILKGVTELGRRIGFTKNIVSTLYENLFFISDEVSEFSKKRKLSQLQQTNSIVSLLLDENDNDAIEKILSQRNFGLAKLEQKTVLADIKKLKPRAVLLSSKYIPIALKIRKSLSFMTIIVIGTLNKQQKKTLLKESVVFAEPPFSDDATGNLIAEAINSSMALDDYWGKFRARPKYAGRVAAAALLAILAAGVYLRSDIKLAAGNMITPDFIAYTTPYSKPSNIIFDGSSFWTCDWYGQGIYKHDNSKDFKLSKVFYFPQRHITALAFGQGFLWTADPWQKKIYKHRLDDELSVVSSFEAPNSAPSGLAWDGERIWSCDAQKGMIFKHRMDAALSIEYSFKSPGPAPSGLYFDGENIWSIDSATNKIYKHRADSSLSVTAVYTPLGFDEKDFNLSGIAGNGKFFWVVSEKAGKVYRFKNTLLKQMI